ncbi:hypothetical protein TWF106_006176 [Orbilia oligospora]|uniref:PCI domain-containing protein n=1 Tax=Orbilia oligospora TaxID=2813651 RepID=A0A6G1LXP6_ORBOL|nr:hypothetical protein TWF788_002512 [Orbilia oligospora]KAF3194592.1 hypothetical protein TWF106_006176 [Orbilia oligospora]KAF3203649.1 hypothetical protein TWF191_002572 [Orbilia oligospora]KAF3214797.1 hypothetical protein TWF679_004580 [Orbilia oligospora]KAF3237678.1 hypothetical protein TWF192_010789 [Orbilia oligospora]
MTTPPWRAAGGTAVQRPSFHPVPVRKNLGKANNNNAYSVRHPNHRHHPYPAVKAKAKNSHYHHEQASQASQQPARRTQFPDALKAYVARTFEDCPSENKAEVEVSLKKIITDAFENKSVWTIDWATHPLPAAARRQSTTNSDKMDISSGDDASPIINTNKKNNFNNVSKGNKRKLSSRIASDKNDFKVTRPDKKYKKTNASDYSDEGPDAFKKLDSRYRRHQTKNVFSHYNAMHSALDSPAFAPIVGRATNLEKRYLRLTSAPDPDTVRPLHVLEKTLELLKSKWKAENNYSYICDQFKSLRQDLTVQHIKNDFTINVYEIHARIALEKADLGEYNQCQSQLANLYSEKIPGGHPHEFKAYRILYLLHTCNRSDMNDILASLTPAEKEDRAILHALAVRSAVAGGNFHRFFKLYLDAPNMGGYLMDSFIDRERLAALTAICKSYRPDIPFRHITEELGFENDAECEAFLVKHNAGNFIKTKESAKDDGINKIVLETAKALPTVEAAKAVAFKKVDIKGQI